MAICQILRFAPFFDDEASNGEPEHGTIHWCRRFGFGWMWETDKSCSKCQQYIPCVFGWHICSDLSFLFSLGSMNKDLCKIRDVCWNTLIITHTFHENGQRLHHLQVIEIVGVLPSPPYSGWEALAKWTPLTSVGTSLWVGKLKVLGIFWKNGLGRLVDMNRYTISVKCSVLSGSRCSRNIAPSCLKNSHYNPYIGGICCIMLVYISGTLPRVPNVSLWLEGQDFLPISVVKNPLKSAGG